MRLSVGVLLLSAVLAPACKSETTDASLEAAPIPGVVQKGPFALGSSVSVRELDATLQATGASFETTTTDDLGHFLVSKNVEAEFVELSAQGFFFDEVRDHVSDAQISLRALARRIPGEALNINVLTDLAVGRIRKLVEDGAPFDDALRHAQQEVLAAFGVTAPEDMASIESFAALDQEASGTGNAILIAISAVMMQAAIDAAGDDSVGATLSGMLARLDADIADNGVIDDEGLVERLRLAAIGVNWLEVRNNLESHFSTEVAAFEEFVDSDGDGPVGAADDNTPDVLIPEDATGHCFATQPEHLTNPLVIEGIPGNVLVTAESGTLYKNGKQVIDQDPLGRWVAICADGDEVTLSLPVPQGYSNQAAASVQVGTDTWEVSVQNGTEAECFPDGAVFVDGVAGSDSNRGSRDEPVASVAVGVAVASTTSESREVRIATGLYADEPDIATDDIVIVGGYDGSDWTAAPDQNPKATEIRCNRLRALGGTITDVFLHGGSVGVSGNVTVENVKLLSSGFEIEQVGAGETASVTDCQIGTTTSGATAIRVSQASAGSTVSIVRNVVRSFYVSLALERDVDTIVRAEANFFRASGNAGSVKVSTGTLELVDNTIVSLGRSTCVDVQGVQGGKVTLMTDNDFSVCGCALSIYDSATCLVDPVDLNDESLTTHGEDGTADGNTWSETEPTL